MHQPNYFPYEPITQTDANGRFSFSIVDVHNQRLGPYRWWPGNAVRAGLGMPHLGAHISFSGSLIENLDVLDAANVNGDQWGNWRADYGSALGLQTSLGNPRHDLVSFGFHHPLMPLLGDRDIRLQIKLHKRAVERAWGTSPSKGIFPPETAFSTRIIPALVAEGVEWAIVDNIHFDRATVNYPHNNASGIYPPNPADQINPDPAANGGAWVQLQNLWAPTQVSAPFGYQPHRAQHVDPSTGEITSMVVVPGARYEGNEDGRGGYGAFLYDGVMDAYLQYNTDPERPMLVLLHHDGDNFGGGSEGYYNGNFQNMVNWATGDSDYDVTTVQDYLDRFPVPADALIHVEDGSWAGADAGDPEFKKWLGDPNAAGVSPDIHSWASMVAARNLVYHADDLEPYTSLDNILNNTGTQTDRAWRYLLAGQASDHWYWDGTEVWDSNVTRGANQAVAQAQPVINRYPGVDVTAPTVFVPQREPYNPGGIEWNPQQPEPSDFTVWTLAHDVSGLSSVTLRWRVDADGINPLSTIDNETYAGGPGVGAWQSIAMSASNVPTPAGVLTPTAKAMRYAAEIAGQTDVLIDYYVEAIDTTGNVERSAIRHVYVGQGGSVGPGGDRVVITPETPIAGEPVTIAYDAAGGPLANAGAVFAHVGFNGWSTVVTPDPLMTDPDGDGVWELTLDVASDAAELNLVFNNGAGVWDNNNGQDWRFDVEGAAPPPFTMDGQLDARAAVVATSANGASRLWAAADGDTLYLATEAPTTEDRFMLIARTPGSLGPAMWGKSGQVAAWDAFVAAESTNEYAAWFDQTGATGIARGTVLEATIDLIGEFGESPATVDAAAASYGTNDGGALNPASQAPSPQITDGILAAGEFVTIVLCELRGDCPTCSADRDADGDADLDDILAYFADFGGASSTDADMDNDGDEDLDDILGYFAAFADC